MLRGGVQNLEKPAYIILERSIKCSNLSLLLSLKDFEKFLVLEMLVRDAVKKKRQKD